MKSAVDPDDYRYTGKGSCKPSSIPTALKKRLYSDKDDLERQLHKVCQQIGDLQEQMYVHDRYSLLLVFQAMDAAGKDGTIKRVMSGIDPHGVEVHSFKRPGEEELDHDYLWRTAKVVPPRGRIGIFNRSYYEEVLVCRVHPEIVTAGQKLPAEATKNMSKLWDRRFREIRNFEAMLHANGTRVVKFFLHVSRTEQAKRFLARIDQPEKNWKFNHGDISERGRWKDYMHAYGAALENTATKDCPWYIIPADDKGDMRLLTAAAILRELRRLKMKWPTLPKEQEAMLAETRKTLVAEVEEATK